MARVYYAFIFCIVKYCGLSFEAFFKLSADC